MSTPARYIVTHIISVGISACIFPLKLMFDTCFGVVGALGSILIDIISILTGDASERDTNEHQIISHREQTVNLNRKKHFSAGDAQSSNSKSIGSRLFEAASVAISSNQISDKKNLTRNASDPNFPISSKPPLLKRSDSLRSPSRHRPHAFKNRSLCPIHEYNSTIQKAHSVPLTKPKPSSGASSFSFSNLLQSCASVFDVFEGYQGSEFTINDSIALVNEVKRKCTCSPSTSGEISPVSTTIWDDGSGRKIRVKVNPALRDRREMVELERQMAKLERRRHKSGELREMRRKEQQQQQQKSLEFGQQGIHIDTRKEDIETIKETSPEAKIIEDAYISVSPKKSYSGQNGSKFVDEGYGSLERITLKKSSPSITLVEGSVDRKTGEGIKSSNLNGTVDKHEGFINSIHDLRSVTGSYYGERISGLDINKENQTNKSNKNFGAAFEISQTLQSTPNTKLFKNNKLQINSLPKVSYNYDSNGIKYAPSENLFAKHTESDQLQYTMENISKRQNTVVNGHSMMPRSMSRSYPEFGTRSPRARTISERMEEKDMVMPLPIFPKSRKCKSMNNVNNGRHGITKPRITGKYNNNPNISAKQALTKEISHWQELVIMSQNKQLEVVKIPKEEAKLGCNSSCKICNENDHCIAHAFNKGSIDKVIVSKTRDLNKFNGKTDTKSHLKINLKRDATQNGIKHKNETQTNLELHRKNNGIRNNDAMKNAIKRTNLRKLRNKNPSIRKRNKEDIKEQMFDASSTKSNLVTGKMDPKTRNV